MELNWNQKAKTEQKIALKELDIEYQWIGYIKWTEERPITEWIQSDLKIEEELKIFQPL